MITPRHADERGRFDHGWLKTAHTFSFSAYHDPAHMGFRSLRVINEDEVRGGAGFGEHPHRDMEIVTYVTAGTLAHRDSTGSVGRLARGDVQAMSAGTGLTHSEFNGSEDEPVRFLQIWLVPDERGLKPRYAERRFDDDAKRGVLLPIASGTAGETDAGPLAIGVDATVFASILGDGEGVEHALPADRHAWLQVVAGAVTVNETRLAAGDGAAIADEPTLTIAADGGAEFLLFDLA